MEKGDYGVGGRGKRDLMSLNRHLKVHKIENFFHPDFGICLISLLVVHK
jgi:hypothetical protein